MEENQTIDAPAVGVDSTQTTVKNPEGSSIIFGMDALNIAMHFLNQVDYKGVQEAVAIVRIVEKLGSAANAHRDKREYVLSLTKEEYSAYVSFCNRIKYSGLEEAQSALAVVNLLSKFIDNVNPAPIA